MARFGVQWPWILLVAAAILLWAAGNAVLAAIQVARQEQALFGGLAEPDGSAGPGGLAQQAAAVMQFNGHIPALLVLLAVMLLAGCRVLIVGLPTIGQRTVSGSARPAAGSRLRPALLGLAAVAGLIALTYAAIAALALTFDSPLIEDAPGLRLFLRSSSMTALALSLAALVLLAPVFLARWAPRPPPADAAVPDEHPESAAADAPQPLSSPPDLIEGHRG